MRKPIEQRIRELEEQKRALQSRLEKQDRAQTTRRKILLGAFVLERLERHDKSSNASALRHLFQVEFLPAIPRDTDRSLFADLLPASEGRTVESGTVEGWVAVSQDQEFSRMAQTDDVARAPADGDGLDGDGDGVADVDADADASSTDQSIASEWGGRS